MAGAGWKGLLLVCAVTCLLSGCAHPDGRILAEILLTEVEHVEDDSGNLKELMQLPGMTDQETADLLGGGEENWTEDKRFYIGRIYHTELYGETCSVFTACGEDSSRTVESVSVWVADGEREVTEEKVQLWLDRLSDAMDSQPFSEYQSVESGARSWKWVKGEMAASMYRMKDILTISFQPAAGGLV